MKTRFGAFTLDLDTRQLTRGTDEVRLSPKAFELLARLVDGRPNALSKEVLHQHLWPGTFVAEANLSNLIGEIREALNDDRRHHEFIRTVHGFGYAFCGRALPSVAADDTAAGEPRCWLEWGARRVALVIGQHVVGRDADAAVRLDAVSVSRRHARVIVDAERTMLEDCESKNGTYLGDQRITSPVQLADGDDIRFGAVRATIRIASASGTTQTHIQARS